MSLPIYVIGHKNPDTDSICAALALAELKRQTGINATAARLGTLNPETKCEHACLINNSTINVRGN